MRFRKLVTVGINESSIDASHWKQIDSLAEERISLTDGSNIEEHLKDADCILVDPFAFKVDKNVIDMAPKLKYIGDSLTAYGKIDTEYAKSKGIIVSNVPGYSTESVAEFVFAIILESIRQLEKGKDAAREGDYSGLGFSLTEIKGKKFGIIGLGRIGSRVAEIASGFGADVMYWSRNRKPELEAKGIKYDDVERMISECDFLSLHLAQTKDTENFLNEDRMQKIKKNSIVINTAPMELVDIGALERRLMNGDMIFILDHSDEMKKDDLARLSKFDNCIIYPAIAHITKEAKMARQEIFVKNIENFLKGSPTNRVN
ncbi:hypothetical protein EPN87_02360 [archaeon]|nr:MAG: hypothetical protein EPN87_02360 [archaeon]